MMPDLAKRVAITVGALLVYRLGLYIPLPGVNLSVWEQIFRASPGGVLGALNLSAGGGIHRLAIFALGIVPYISAAVLLQLATMASQRFKALRNQGDSGRQVIVRRTRALTALLAAFQALGVAVGLEGVAGVVADPGGPFVTFTVVTLTGGTMFLVWLSEQITLRGVGNGIALFLLAGSVTELPGAIVGALELGRQGVLSPERMAALVLIVVAVTALIVLVELARRKLPVRFRGREVGIRTLDDQSSCLSLKLNSAGVIPVLLASWLLLAVIALANLAAGDSGGWLAAVLAQLGPGRPLYLILYAAFIVLCAFFYTAFVWGPEEIAESLSKRGGTIPTIEAGDATAAHIDHTVSRITVIGAGYLALVCLIPEILSIYAAVPFYFGGTSLLISVCTVLDLQAQLRRETGLRPSA